VKRLIYQGVLAQQSAEHQVITIAAPASDIHSFARIDRAGRDSNGALRGFQRPQIASHIREIRDYLQSPNAVLPNPIVVAFVGGVHIRKVDRKLVELTIALGDEPPGFVVDGQQRLSALAGLSEKDFEVFVSVLVCNSYDELRRQFVLINSTRPLPKALIYELLPGVVGLPARLTNRSFAASLTERLNFDPSSSLKSLIYQHTNPGGIIRDTAVQKIIMQSASDGAIREMPQDHQFEGGFDLINEFFAAVQSVFKRDWDGHNPRTSRLVHGAGVVALGYVMELLVARDGAATRSDFERGLSVLVGKTAWTAGHWKFSSTERVPWNGIENTPRQIMALGQHLISLVRHTPKKTRGGRRKKAS